MIIPQASRSVAEKTSSSAQGNKVITTAKYNSSSLLFQTTERIQRQRVKQIPGREGSKTGDLLDVSDFGQQCVQMLSVVCAELHPVSGLRWITWCG